MFLVELTRCTAMGFRLTPVDSGESGASSNCSDPRAAAIAFCTSCACSALFRAATAAATLPVGENASAPPNPPTTAGDAPAGAPAEEWVGEPSDGSCCCPALRRLLRNTAKEALPASPPAFTDVGDCDGLQRSNEPSPWLSSSPPGSSSLCGRRGERFVGDGASFASSATSPIVPAFAFCAASTLSTIGPCAGRRVVLVRRRALLRGLSAPRPTPVLLRLMAGSCCRPLRRLALG